MSEIYTDKDGKIIGGIWDGRDINLSAKPADLRPKTLLGLPVIWGDEPSPAKSRNARRRRKAD